MQDAAPRLTFTLRDEERLMMKIGVFVPYWQQRLAHFDPRAAVHADL